MCVHGAHAVSEMSVTVYCQALLSVRDFTHRRYYVAGLKRWPEPPALFTAPNDLEKSHDT